MTIMRLLAVLSALALGWAGAAPAVQQDAVSRTVPVTPAGQAVQAELEFHRILVTSDREGLRAYFKNAKNPEVFRARALLALYPPKKNGVLATSERVELMNGLADPTPTVRLSAIQVLGRSGDPAFARQLLQLAAEDPATFVRSEALRAARPWTKLTHLYFLEAALNAEATEVKVEALKSIGELKDKEISPTLRDRVYAHLTPDLPPAQRLAALDTLNRWGRLNWNLLKNILVESKEPEALRLRALELSDSLHEAQRERQALLSELVSRESSVPLAYGAFQRLKTLDRNDKSFLHGISRFLENTGQRNKATEEIAAFLRSLGFRVSYNVGAWTVSGKL